VKDAYSDGFVSCAEEGPALPACFLRSGSRCFPAGEVVYVANGEPCLPASQLPLRCVALRTCSAPAAEFNLLTGQGDDNHLRCHVIIILGNGNA
jgi:hypothetical protein